MGGPSRFGVVGNPIAHSLSPDIHDAFAKSLGIEMAYERYLLPEERFKDEARALFDAGLQGLNVTVPFKQEACAFAEEVDPLALMAGAVNTLDQKSGRIIGYNTDGIGMVRDLQVRHNINLDGASALILGAGGACRGIIQPLLNAGVETIWIGNRTLPRAQEIVQQFQGADGRSLSAVSLEALSKNAPKADLLVNSTSLGLDHGDIRLPPQIAAGKACYDLSYGRQARFAQWASANGASVSLDGLGMLVEQAAESFEIWLGHRPDTEPVYQLLRQRLG